MELRPFDKPIFVTRPFLPPLSEFLQGLEEIWQNQWLTNGGPITLRFEKQLAAYLENRNISLFTNGTLALQIAVQGMDIAGEVITTPFSFVATTHALYWNKIRPVFCDIDPDYYNIDPDRIEDLITPWTTAILAVHVFGHPCNLERLEYIARKHHLKLLYDAAHAFGVRVDGRPITDFGDLSVLSFHATKTFHSIEGGALLFKDGGLKHRFDYLKNFGFKSETEVVMPGTNAKMNEFQALMGLQVLTRMDQIINKRKQIYDTYHERLSGIAGMKLCPKISESVVYNYSYIPVQIYEKDFGISRDVLVNALKEYNIFARKYFYPIIPDYSCYKNLRVTDSLSTARAVSSRIITLPIYHDLSVDDVHRICDIILHIQEKKN